MRLVIGRHVLYARRIEHGDVGLHAGAQHAAIAKTETRSGKRGHLAHRVLQSNHALLAHVHAKHAGERAVAARMRGAHPEHRHLAVGCNHGRRVSHHALHVLLGGRMKHASAAAVLHKPQRGFRRVVHRGLQPAQVRNVGQVLPRERRIPLAQRDYDVAWIAATALGQNDRDCFRLDLRARRRFLQARDRLLQTAFQRPLRQQRSLDGRARCGVRILIEGRVHTACACCVDQLQGFYASAPVGLAYHLVVRHLRGHATLLADGDGLPDAIDNAGGLVAHVRGMQAAKGRHHLLQFHHLGERCERARHVEETRGEPERAVLHVLQHKNTHAL